MSSRSQFREWLSRAEGGDIVGVLAEVTAARAADGFRRHLDHRLERADSEMLGQLWHTLYGTPALASTGHAEGDATVRGAIARIPPKVELGNPGPFLDLLTREPHALSLEGSFILHPWAIVGLAALGRPEQADARRIITRADDNGARFAHALGLDDVLDARSTDDWGEPGRTVRLRRLTEFPDIEPVAHRIAALIAPSDVSARETLQYVLIELLRNVLQHSRDRSGAVVAAQRMTADQKYGREAIQVAVADTGIGILEALRGRHRELASAEAAVEKSLRAHISGTFEEGRTGSLHNAGFGLFAISELAKLTRGRLLVATRGAALLLRPNPDVPDGHQSAFVPPPHTGFPGTLVAFELPLDGTSTMDALMEEVKRRARLQRPGRIVRNWLRFEAGPPEAERILVRLSHENPTAAEQVARRIATALFAGEPMLLDFEGMSFVTQSFLHALLFKPLRLAWAEQFPVYVVNASPAVRSALELLEEYALAG